MPETPESSRTSLAASQSRPQVQRTWATRQRGLAAQPAQNVSSTPVGDAASPPSVAEADQPTRVLGCPMCGSGINLRERAFLYNVRICRPCEHGFLARRFLAFAVDLLLAGLLVNAVVAPLCTRLETFGLGALGRALINLGPLLLLMWKDGFAGHSPGKWLFGLRVIATDSWQPIGFWRSFKRNLCLLVPFVVFVIADEVWHGQPRRGDKWAGTKVIWRRYAHCRPFLPPGHTCPGCGYNLTGNTSGRCPECGQDIPEEIRRCIPQPSATTHEE